MRITSCKEKIMFSLFRYIFEMLLVEYVQVHSTRHKKARTAGGRWTQISVETNWVHKS